MREAVLYGAVHQERAPMIGAPPTVPSGTVAAILAMRPAVGKGGPIARQSLWRALGRSLHRRRATRSL
jgi:hypothetical protein